MIEPSIFAEPPRVIPRRFMPQVSEADYPSLFLFLASHGVTVESILLEPSALHFRQHIGRLHPVPATVLYKPVLVASDNAILDGNHRAGIHRKLGTRCPCYRLSLPFLDAIALLFSFAGTTTINQKGE